jgi:hypothetical protein
MVVMMGFEMVVMNWTPVGGEADLEDGVRSS